MEKLTIELPYDFRIIRRNADSLELQSKEPDFDFTNKVYLDTKSWKFVGYYSSVNTALRGYIRKCPLMRLEGTVTLKEVHAFMREVDEIADRFSRGEY